jgi:hypothetical protein
MAAYIGKVFIGGSLCSTGSDWWELGIAGQLITMVSIRVAYWTYHAHILPDR